MNYNDIETAERARKDAAREAARESARATEHPALAALHAAHRAMSAPTGDQQQWKDILENTALPVVRAAIPALEALLAERDELRAALTEIVGNAELAPPGETFAREVLCSRGAALAKGGA